METPKVYPQSEEKAGQVVAASDCLPRSMKAMTLGWRSSCKKGIASSAKAAK